MRYDEAEYPAGRGKSMLQTLEAIIDEDGNIRLLEPAALPVGRRVLVTILNEVTAPSVAEITLLSEAALAEDWERPEEDAAWSHLQPPQ